jgi:hypothetical protein
LAGVAESSPALENTVLMGGVMGNGFGGGRHGLVAFQCAVFAEEICLKVGDRIQDALSSIIELLYK